MDIKMSKNFQIQPGILEKKKTCFFIELCGIRPTNL